MENKNMTYLCTAKTSMEAEQIVDLLKEQNIYSYFQKDLMNIYCGDNTLSDNALYVDAKDLENAKALLAAYPPVKTYSDSSSDSQPPRQLPRVVSIGLLVIMILILFLTVFICISRLI